MCFGQFENIFYNANFSGGSVKAAEASPVVDHQTGAYQLTASVDGARDEGNLKKRRKFILGFNVDAWVKKTT